MRRGCSSRPGFRNVEAANSWASARINLPGGPPAGAEQAERAASETPAAGQAVADRAAAEVKFVAEAAADDPIPPASSPRIPIPRILLLLNLAYNASAMVHLRGGVPGAATTRGAPSSVEFNHRRRTPQ